MNNHHFTCKSFKYLGARIQNETNASMHPTVRSEFDEKIDLLRVPVYDKKKKFKKNNSKNQIINPQLVLTTEGERPKTKKIQSRENSESRQKHYRYKSVVNSRQAKKKFLKSSLAFQEVKKSESNALVDIIRSEKEIQRESSTAFDRNERNANNAKENNSLKMNNGQNLSQSLLRKNSLFLLNFMRRKEKKEDENQKDKNPHIAGIPNVASNMRITYTPQKQIKFAKTYRKPVPVPQERIVSTLSKILNNLPIEPW